MLIIGREIGQSVIIGENVKVTVVQYASKLRLAIDAPDDMPVSRIQPESASRFKKNHKVLGDTVKIGENIKVTVFQTETGLLRFAIDAPKEVSIYREELIQPKEATGQIS